MQLQEAAEMIFIIIIVSLFLMVFLLNIIIWYLN